MKKIAYVTIKCKDKTNEELIKFIEDNLVDIEIEKVKNGEALIRWPLNEQEGIHEIEETLYYVLENNEIGDYSYYVPDED